MNAIEAAEAFAKFTEENALAHRGWISFGLRSPTEQMPDPLSCTFYPNGIGYGEEVRVSAVGGDWQQLYDNLAAQWEIHKGTATAARIEAMAIAIIEITHRYGRCADYHLRLKDFGDGEIRNLGSMACALALEMGQGPFEILSGAEGNRPSREVVRDEP